MFDVIRFSVLHKLNFSRQNSNQINDINSVNCWIRGRINLIFVPCCVLHYTACVYNGPLIWVVFTSESRLVCHSSSFAWYCVFLWTKISLSLGKFGVHFLLMLWVWLSIPDCERNQLPAETFIRDDCDVKPIVPHALIHACEIVLIRCTVRALL